MLDIVVIRRDPDRVRRSLRRRGHDPSVLDEVLRLDAEYRSARSDLETLQAARKTIASEIAKARDRTTATSENQAKAESLKRLALEKEMRVRELSPEAPGSRLRKLLEQLPNLLDQGVPDGDVPVTEPQFQGLLSNIKAASACKPHWEIGEALGILDVERATRMSGSRFSILKAKGAQLARALTQYFLNEAVASGYTEIVPPYLVTRETMWSTGQLSKFSDAMYADADAGLFMIPTGEVPLTALHAGETLSAMDLPLKYVAYTPCFRKEAGAAGKDTRGLTRQHQFEKVELVWLTKPEDSSAALEKLKSDAAALLIGLELPYRIVTLAARDVGFNAAKTYDLEVWMPSSKAYREISSCSNCTDFQARRAATRFRPHGEKKPQFVHTLNGSALAVGRTLAAILENFQRADGSVAVPQVLQPYTGFDLLK